MLDRTITNNSEKIWTKDNKLAGYLCGGTYYQEYQDDHIKHHGVSKGMDKSIYLYLAGRGCKRWTIIHKFTKFRLSMPFNKIAILLKTKKAKELDLHRGYGLQIFIDLEDFNECLPAVQENMF